MNRNANIIRIAEDLGPQDLATGADLEDKNPLVPTVFHRHSYDDDSSIFSCDHLVREVPLRSAVRAIPKLFTSHIELR